MTEIVFRRATSADVEFLVEAVLAAETIPGDPKVTLYERVFDLSARELRAFLTEYLSNEGTGHQLTFSSFLVLGDRAAPLACCAAWMESSGAQSSGFQTATALAAFLGADRWRSRRQQIKILTSVAPKRASGELQLETFYVTPSERGRGLVSRLIQHALDSFNVADTPALSAQISLFRERGAARRAYERAGFVQCWETPLSTSDFKALTGSDGFVQLRRSITRTPPVVSHFAV